MIALDKHRRVSTKIAMLKLMDAAMSALDCTGHLDQIWQLETVKLVIFILV
jgi:hypothetical protein